MTDQWFWGVYNSVLQVLFAPTRKSLLTDCYANFLHDIKKKNWNIAVKQH